MLTGEVFVTKGNAWIKGYSVVNELDKVQSDVGYCPQFDALLGFMTVRETLTLYARIRCIASSDIPECIESLCKFLCLDAFIDTRCGRLSGGNKRKLSIAMSLIGNPNLILLDEPSAGVDPSARRKIWTFLGQMRASGKTLVLTSHSMDETEALCTKICIMINGKFVCLGTPTHLKNKFAQGFTLIVHLKHLPDGNFQEIDPIFEYINKRFQSTSVFESQPGYAQFQIEGADVEAADIFECMEMAKELYAIEDYIVQRTSLQQVFLKFTKGRLKPSRKDKGFIQRTINHWRSRDKAYPTPTEIV